MSIKRYTLFATLDTPNSGPLVAPKLNVIEQADGSWVKYDDHAAEVERVTRERDEARAALAEVAPAIHAAHDLILREYAEPDPTTGEAIAWEARPVWRQVCDALVALDALTAPEEADRA